MLTLRSATTILLLVTFASSFGMAAQPNEDSKTLETVVSKLDAIFGRIAALEKRVSRLEASLMRISRLDTSRLSRPVPDVIGTVGTYRIDKRGFLFDRDGRCIGIWGVNGK